MRASVFQRGARHATARRAYQCALRLLPMRRSVSGPISLSRLAESLPGEMSPAVMPWPRRQSGRIGDGLEHAQALLEIARLQLDCAVGRGRFAG